MSGAERFQLGMATTFTMRCGGSLLKLPPAHSAKHSFKMVLQSCDKTHVALAFAQMLRRGGAKPPAAHEPLRVRESVNRGVWGGGRVRCKPTQSRRAIKRWDGPGRAPSGVQASKRRTASRSA